MYWLLLYHVKWYCWEGLFIILKPVASNRIWTVTRRFPFPNQRKAYWLSFLCFLIYILWIISITSSHILRFYYAGTYFLIGFNTTAIYSLRSILGTLSNLHDLHMFDLNQILIDKYIILVKYNILLFYICSRLYRNCIYMMCRFACVLNFH